MAELVETVARAIRDEAEADEWNDLPPPGHEWYARHARASIRATLEAAIAAVEPGERSSPEWLGLWEAAWRLRRMLAALDG